MKIIDAFTFFNEKELLKIRLEELYDQVDHFVICESTKTYQNKEKPLYFQEWKSEFSDFLPKIIHHVFDPQIYPFTWYIENEQRRELKKACPQLNDGDIFLMSDLDEIISADAVKFIRENEIDMPITAIMQMSYWYLDTIIEEPWHHKGWRGTVILPKKHYDLVDLQTWRDQKDNLARLENAGWHFSFIGGPERVKTKIEAYAHTEFNNNNFTNLETIKERLKNLKDPLGRPEFKFKIETDKSKFPKSSLKFKELFLS